MEQTQSISHIVQVYQPSTDTKISTPQIIHITHPVPQDKVCYQETLTESMTLSHVDIQNQQLLTENQVIMSCHQTLQNIHQPVHIQRQGAEMAQSVQITSHFILPPLPVYKQNVLMNNGQYYEHEQYSYGKNVNVKTEDTHNDQQCSKMNDENDTKTTIKQEKTRNKRPNPSKWACNIRKAKHQSGEAYINKRGKLVPAKQVRTTKDCLKSCKMKCSEHISDTDREQIFKAFYSLNSNEKKHFLLNTTERNLIKNVRRENAKRQYLFKYFFLVRAVRYVVCKNFYLGTLAISQKPIYNVHMNKSEMNTPKPDGRGLSESSSHGLSAEVKDRVRRHIKSFETCDSKPVKRFSKRKQYLKSCATVIEMYTKYATECVSENVIPVRESMYRRILKEEFNLHFKKVKNEVVCCKCKGSVKNELSS